MSSVRLDLRLWSCVVCEVKLAWHRPRVWGFGDPNPSDGPVLSMVGKISLGVDMMFRRYCSTKLR
jgi:hypothetical protein